MPAKTSEIDTGQVIPMDDDQDDFTDFTDFRYHTAVNGGLL